MATLEMNKREKKMQNSNIEKVDTFRLLTNRIADFFNQRDNMELNNSMIAFWKFTATAEWFIPSVYHKSLFIY